MDERCRLYLITPSQFEIHAFAESFQQACEGGDVACLQVRMKESSQDEMRRALEVLLPLCRARNIPLLINDVPALVSEMGIDGVHVGEGFDKKGTIHTLREQLGEQVVIGISCYGSTERAILFGEEGADYVSFGAFYPTTTKTPKARPEPSLLHWWSEHSVIPCVAIGGITPANCTPLVQAGAQFIAAVSYVWQHPEGAKQAVKAFNQAIEAAIAKRAVS